MLCWSYTEAYLVKEALVAIRSLLQDKDVSTSAFGCADLRMCVVSVSCVCCTDFIVNIRVQHSAKVDNVQSFFSLDHKHFAWVADASRLAIHSMPNCVTRQTVQ